MFVVIFDHLWLIMAHPKISCIVLTCLQCESREADRAASFELKDLPISSALPTPQCNAITREDKFWPANESRCQFEWIIANLTFVSNVSMQHFTQGLLSTILDPQEAIFTTMLLIPGQYAICIATTIWHCTPLSTPVWCNIHLFKTDCFLSNPSDNSAIRALHLLEQRLLLENWLIWVIWDVWVFP